MTDWLARKVRGVIDFRLPGDPLELSREEDRRRTLEYLEQVRAASPGWGVGNTNIRQKPAQDPAKGTKTSRRGPESAQDHAPEQGDWWREY